MKEKSSFTGRGNDVIWFSDRGLIKERLYIGRRLDRRNTDACINTHFCRIQEGGGTPVLVRTKLTSPNLWVAFQWCFEIVDTVLTVLITGICTSKKHGTSKHT